MGSKSVSNASSNGAGFSGILDIVGGFHPVTAAPVAFDPTQRSAPHPPPSLPEMTNTTFISDPFISNKSIPFQAVFQPGEPQFGGFGASDFGQRFEKAPPVFFSKRVVPVSSIVPNLPSRLGNVFQAGKPSDFRGAMPNHGEIMAAQHSVIFRAPAPQDGVPPPPPKLPVPQRPPNGSLIRRVVRPGNGPHRHHLISADGTPIGDGQSVIAPPSLKVDRPVPHSVRGDGPFMGTTPPPIPSDVPQLPQFMPHNRGQKPQLLPPAALGQRNSDSRPPVPSRNTDARPANSSSQNDFAILSNVMSIINHEKESEHIRQQSAQRRPQRRGRSAEKEEPAAEPSPEPEPVASSDATSQDNDNMLHEHNHDMSNMNPDNNMKDQDKTGKPMTAQHGKTDSENNGICSVNHTGFTIMAISMLGFIHWFL